MNRIQRLSELFARFPGIGPRQAQRFVFFLLTQPKSFHTALIELLENLSDDVVRCSSCYRFFTTENKETTQCAICRDNSRNTETLMVIEKDVDLDAIEKSGVYKGRYFVLGGTVPVLEQEPERRVRSRELVHYLEKEPVKEMIFAFSANPDGDHTYEYIQKTIDAVAKKKKIKRSMLGRGLSTGSELEYSDPETIKNALKNRQ